MLRALASNALTLLIVGLFLMGGLVVWGQSQYKAEGPLESAMCLQVRSGSNMTRVSQELEDDGAISSAMIFRMAADYTDKSQQLKAGSFLVREGGVEFAHSSSFTLTSFAETQAQSTTFCAEK